MKVSELMERLEDFDPDAEVRLATQPSWPLQYHLADEIVGPDEVMDALCEDVESDEDETPDQPANIVYLAEASQVYDTPYLPSGVSRALGWR